MFVNMVKKKVIELPGKQNNFTTLPMIWLTFTHAKMDMDESGQMKKKKGNNASCRCEIRHKLWN